MGHTTCNPWSPWQPMVTYQAIMVTNGDGNVGQTWNNDVFTMHGETTQLETEGLVVHRIKWRENKLSLIGKQRRVQTQMRQSLHFRGFQIDAIWYHSNTHTLLDKILMSNE